VEASSLIGCVLSTTRSYRAILTNVISFFSTAAEAFPLHEQDSEENFDLALVGALEIDVVPHLGDMRLPDSLVAQLGKILFQGSRLHEPSPRRGEQWHVSPLVHSASAVNGHSRRAHASRDSLHRMSDERERESVDFGSFVPRERFSFWCLDLLFLVCSDTAKGKIGCIMAIIILRVGLCYILDHEASRRRLAALSLPSLLNRCQTTMAGFVSDESTRGNLPFSRLVLPLVYTI
jgi:hypothetical protein